MMVPCLAEVARTAFDDNDPVLFGVEGQESRPALECEGKGVVPMGGIDNVGDFAFSERGHGLAVGRAFYEDGERVSFGCFGAGRLTYGHAGFSARRGLGADFPGKAQQKRFQINCVEVVLREMVGFFEQRFAPVDIPDADPSPEA